VADIRAHWLPEAVRVDVGDPEAWALPDTGAAEVPPDLVRLLGPHDLLPRTAGPLLTVRLDLWSPVSPATRERLGQEAERLAVHRGVALAGFDEA